MCEPGILSCSVASTHLQGGRGGFQVPGAKALKVGSELAPFPLLCSLTHWHLYPRGQQSSSRRGQNQCLVQARAHAGPLLAHTSQSFGPLPVCYLHECQQGWSSPHLDAMLGFTQFCPSKLHTLLGIGRPCPGGNLFHRAKMVGVGTWLKLKYALGWS